MTDFVDYARELRPAVERELDAVLPPASEAPARLHEAMRYCVFAGGKRIRPALVVLGGEIHGCERAHLMPAAAAVELVHTFSLVHDDLPALDDDDLRRGRATAHRAFDEATAVLAGDALLNLGLGVLARAPDEASAEVRVRAVALLAEGVGTRGMIGGQVDDLAAEAEWPRDAADALVSIHGRKTGALLVASLRLGALYAGVDADSAAALVGLGEELGLMFQIADDILDVEGEPETLGKSARKDLRDGKLTYPALYGVDGSRELLDKARERALGWVDSLPSLRETARSLIDYLARRDR